MLQSLWCSKKLGDVMDLNTRTKGKKRPFQNILEETKIEIGNSRKVSILEKIKNFPRKDL